MSASPLAYLGIGVSDMSAWDSVATDILGMPVTERGDDGTVSAPALERPDGVL